MTNDDWIEVNMTTADWQEVNNFDEPPWLAAGMLVQIKGRTYMVGHVNLNNGGCGCCGGIDRYEVIERYKRVWKEDV